MKRIYTLLLVLTVSLSSFAQLSGTTWMMSPQAGALAVGPALDNLTWWSNSAGDVTARACFFDDSYVFNTDGSFQNVLGTETWLEGWQGVEADGCGAPVAPHDGTVSATWAYDAGAGTITVTGVGAFLGIPKPNNSGELTTPADAPASITYDVTFSENDTKMTLSLNYGAGFWQFIMVKNTATSINSTNFENIKMFATKGVLTVKTNDLINGKIEVYSVTGQEVVSKTISTEKEQLAIPTNALYIVRISDSNKQVIETRKVFAN